VVEVKSGKNKKRLDNSVEKIKNDNNIKKG
jgi:hypothetical protein